MGIREVVKQKSESKSENKAQREGCLQVDTASGVSQTGEGGLGNHMEKVQDKAEQMEKPRQEAGSTQAPCPVTAADANIDPDFPPAFAFLQKLCWEKRVISSKYLTCHKLKICSHLLTGPLFNMVQNAIGTSRVVQQLRLVFPLQEPPVQSLVREARSHMQCSVAKK